MKRTVTKTYSDISGEADAATVRFSFEKAQYEIDLTRADREEFVRAIAGYTAKGRKVRRRGD